MSVSRPNCVLMAWDERYELVSLLQMFHLRKSLRPRADPCTTHGMRAEKELDDNCTQHVIPVSLPISEAVVRVVILM